MARRKAEGGRRCVELKHGVEVLLAACLTLNQVGEGSTPSSPTCMVKSRETSVESRFMLRALGSRPSALATIFDNLVIRSAPMM